MNHVVNSRLAARAGVRQVEASLRADATAAAVDIAITRSWRAFLSAMKNYSYALAKQPNVLRLALAQLAGAAEGAVANNLDRLAKWSADSSATILGSTLPLEYLQAAAMTPVAEAYRASAWEAGRTLRESEAAGGALSRKELRNKYAAILFPTPSQEEIDRIVYSPTNGVSWRDRLAAASRFASADQLAQVVATGFGQGKSQQEIAAQLVPVVDGVRSSARRIARTEALRISHAIQHKQHERLGDLVVGYQIHATLDQNTRPAHAARNGTIYYKQPKNGQLGLDDMPHPPQEADGSIAWNCRCYLTAVLAPPSWLVNDPAKMAIFETGQGKVIPDPVVYSDWFDSTDDRRRKLATGPRRFETVKELLGGVTPTWEHFVDPETGDLLGLDVLRGESDEERDRRVGIVRQILTKRRQLLQTMSKFGFIAS